MYDLNHETDLFEMLRVKVACNKFPGQWIHRGYNNHACVFFLK
jgi:hypothetical protein